jgi:YbbR domain-containing protein
MKKKLTRNIGLKILSILLAVILWIVITNVDDPIESKTFHDIPVTIINEKIVKTEKQSYEILEGETVDIKIAAKRSILEKLTSENFRAKADFAGLTEGDIVYLDLECTRYGEDEVRITNSNEKMKIRREELSSEDFKVNVTLTGEVTDGFYVSEKLASPNIIRVSGPKSRVDKVNQVVVEVNVNGLSDSTSRIALPKALDEDKNEIDATRLDFSEKYITVNLKILKTKTVELRVKTSGEPAPGYVMTAMDYQPKEVTIAAEDNVLNKINYLTVTEDISGASGNIEKEINLLEAEELKGGVTLVGDDHKASIKITVEKLETREISIWPNDIDFLNKMENLDARVITPGPISIELLGPLKELDDITRHTLNPYIDLSGFDAGTYSLPVKAEMPKYTTMPDIVRVAIRLE